MGRSLLQEELHKKHPFESLEQEVGLNLVRTSERLREPFGELFKRHGISGSQYNALRILRGHGKPLPSLDIAEQMITREPDITRLVDRLVKSGLAERHRTDADRRVVLVKITRKGLDLLARLDAPVLEAHRSQLAHLTRRELQELNRLLVKARRPDAGEDSED